MAFVLVAFLLAAPTDQPEPATRWYGWQTLLTDAGSIAFAAATGAHGSSDTESTVLGITSAAFYFAGGPAVHIAHGRWRTGLADFGIRVGVPFVAGLLGGAITSANSSPGSDCPGCAGAVGFLFGAFLGGVSASVIDAVWLTREPVEQSKSARLVIVPSLARAKGRNGEMRPTAGLLAAF